MHGVWRDMRQAAIIVHPGERLENRIFAISYEHLGSVSPFALTTHLEGFIEPDLLPLHSDQFTIIKLHSNWS